MFKCIANMTNENETVIRKLGNTDVDQMYNDICRSILATATMHLPRSVYNKHTKPYWSKNVQAAHSKQRHARRVWIEAGWYAICYIRKL